MPSRAAAWKFSSAARERHLRPDRPVVVGEHPRRARSRRRRWPGCRRRSGRRAARGSRRAGAGTPARRRRRSGGSSGRSCRCAARSSPSRGVAALERRRTGPRRRRSAAARGSSGRSPRRGRRLDVTQRSPNHTRGRTPCALSSSGRVSVACSNSAMRVSRHSSLAEEVRRVRADRELHAGDRLRGVPVPREVLGVDLLVELHARARRLGRDRVGVRVEPLGARRCRCAGPRRARRRSAR